MTFRRKGLLTSRDSQKFRYSYLPARPYSAAKYPAKVRRLVAVSANIRPDAIYPSS
jgi:hypothetical protein